MEISDDELRGRTAIGADGQAIGEVTGVVIDSQGWTIRALRLRLRSQVAEQIGVGHSLFRAGTVEVPVDQVQSVGDAVVLNVPAAQLGAAGVHQEGASAFPARSAPLQPPVPPSPGAAVKNS